MSEEPISVFDLSTEKKLTLIEELWADLTASQDEVPIPEWHREELDRRLASRSADVARLATWDEVKLRIQRRNV